MSTIYWLFDFKYDGFRAICYLEQRRNRLISRNNNAMTRFEALTSQVAAALNIDDAILDGEIIAADETGRPVFIDLLRGTRSPCYIAFDLLWLNGIDLRSLPLASVGGPLGILLGIALWPVLGRRLNGDENDQGKTWRFDSRQIRTEKATLYRFE